MANVVFVIDKISVLLCGLKFADNNGVVPLKYFANLKKGLRPQERDYKKRI